MLLSFAQSMCLPQLLLIWIRGHGLMTSEGRRGGIYIIILATKWIPILARDILCPIIHSLYAVNSSWLISAECCWTTEKQCSDQPCSLLCAVMCMFFVWGQLSGTCLLFGISCRVHVFDQLSGECLFVVCDQVNTLTTVGGSKLQETVRRMMCKLATNEVWSLYSLRGPNVKMSLYHQPMCRSIISKCSCVTDVQLHHKLKLLFCLIKFSYDQSYLHRTFISDELIRKSFYHILWSMQDRSCAHKKI